MTVEAVEVVDPAAIPADLVAEATSPDPRFWRAVVGFDGVLYSYASGWQGPTVLPDAPVPGAIAWLNSLAAEGFEVVVQTPRARYEGSAAAIHEWLAVHGYEGPAPLVVERMQASVIVDRTAFRFRGRFPAAGEIRRKLVPWRVGQPTAAEVNQRFREKRERHAEYVLRLEQSNGRLKKERADLREQLLREILRSAGFDDDVVDEWLRQNADKPFEAKHEVAVDLRRESAA